MAVALACFEIGLKEAPHAGWASLPVMRSPGRRSGSPDGCSCGAPCAATAPSSTCAPSRTARFALGCVLSFLLGISLYGMVYLMPVFLAFVRGHDAL